MSVAHTNNKKMVGTCAPTCHPHNPLLSIFSSPSCLSIGVGSGQPREAGWAAVGAGYERSGVADGQSGIARLGRTVEQRERLRCTHRLRLHRQRRRILSSSARVSSPARLYCSSPTLARSTAATTSTRPHSAPLLRPWPTAASGAPPLLLARAVAGEHD